MIILMWSWHGSHVRGWEMVLGVIHYVREERIS